MTPQADVVSWYVNYQKEHIKKNPTIEQKFLRTLENAPEDIFQELKNATPRILHLASVHFRDGMSLDYENGFEGFCRVVVDEMKKVFLN